MKRKDLSFNNENNLSRFSVLGGGEVSEEFVFLGSVLKAGVIFLALYSVLLAFVSHIF